MELQPGGEEGDQRRAERATLSGCEAEPEAEADPEELRAFLRDWVSPYALPPTIAIRESFPRTTSGKVDRLQYYEAVLPSVAVNMSTYAPAGQGGDSSNLPPETYRMRSYHFITPIDAHSTRYHWFQHYNTNPQDEAVRRQLNDGARGAFEEDRVGAAVRAATHAARRMLGATNHHCRAKNGSASPPL